MSTPNALFMCSSGGVIPHVLSVSMVDLIVKWGESPLSHHVVDIQNQNGFLYCCGRGDPYNIAKLWIRPVIFICDAARPKIEIPLTANSRKNKIPLRAIWQTMVTDSFQVLYGIDLDQNDNIYVTGSIYYPTDDIDDPDNRNVWKLDSDGTLLDSYLAGGADETIEGKDIACDNSGNVYICGVRVWRPGADRILKVDLGGGGWSYDTGASCWEITVDAAGNVYVAGTRSGNKSFWKLSSAGALLMSGDTGSHAHAIAVDADSNIYVGGDPDGGDNVWKFSAGGVEQWGSAMNGPYVRGVCLDKAGEYLYACSSNGMIAKFRASDGTLTNENSIGNIYTYNVTVNNVPLV